MGGVDSVRLVYTYATAQMKLGLRAKKYLDSVDVCDSCGLG